jgi:hypothetical protein
MGWQLAGVSGLAAGGALGAVAALALVTYRLARLQGRAVFALVTLGEPIGIAAVLAVLRPHPALWLVAAIVAGVRTGVRFVRPGARHARRPNLMVPLYRRLRGG